MKPTRKHTLLVVDDEPDVCDSVRDLLRREFNVLTAKSAAEGCRLLQEHEVHILITDQRMPQVTGVELLTRARAGHPQAVRLMFTGYADLDACIEWSTYRFVPAPQTMSWAWAPVGRHGLEVEGAAGLLLAGPTLEAPAAIVDIGAYAGLAAARRALEVISR